MMRRRAKRVREGQAQERKKEGKPAYFGVYVKTRLRKTGLVKTGRGHVSLHHREALNIGLGKLRVSQAIAMTGAPKPTLTQPKRRKSSQEEGSCASTSLSAIQAHTWEARKEYSELNV